MKLLCLSAGLLLGLLSFCQAPALFNYQGVARNSVGNVMKDKAIVLRLSIHDGTPAGPVVYTETRSLVTNVMGMFNVQVGSPGATTVTGTIATVNWATGAKFLQVEIDADGAGFRDIGSAQLASVPYALHAGTALPGGSAGGDLGGTYPNPSVVRIQGRNISNATPVNGQALLWNNAASQWQPGDVVVTNYWTASGNNIVNNNTGTVGISASSAIELGFDVPGKGAAAGTIRYRPNPLQYDTLDIYGGASEPAPTGRRIKFWNEGGAVFTGDIHLERNRLFTKTGGFFNNVLPLAMAQISGPGNVSAGTANISSSFNVNHYELTIDEGVVNTIKVITPLGGPTTPRYATWVNGAPNQVWVYIWEPNNPAPVQGAFSIVIFRP